MLKRYHTWEISESENEEEPGGGGGETGGRTERTEEREERHREKRDKRTKERERQREERDRRTEERERQKEERERQKEEKQRQERQGRTEERERQKEEKDRQKEEKQRQERRGRTEERERQKGERDRQKEERQRQGRTEERERQKREKERQREEREWRTEERKRQKRERDRQREEERERRKEAAERIKRLKPEEYLKTVTVKIHPVLLQDSGCDVLLNTLAGLEWRSRIEEHNLTHTISWSRDLPQDEDGSVVEEYQVLMVVTQMEFVDMMMSIRQALIGGCKEAESLFQPLCDYLNRNTGIVLSLLVTGGQFCQWGVSYGDDDEDELCPRSQLGLHDLDIEEVLVYLQMYKNVTVHFLFGWQEVTDHVCAVTKALSKRPFRTLQDVPDLGFCVEGLWAGGVRVERSGRGLAQVWTRQIQQLNRVSIAMATAVTTAYPSPQLLLQAYERSESAEERCGLLADVTVKGGARERRVGPELSGRVHRLMTSQNPDLVLD